jgi:hypothetical protein
MFANRSSAKGGYFTVELTSSEVEALLEQFSMKHSQIMDALTRVDAKYPLWVSVNGVLQVAGHVWRHKHLDDGLVEGSEDR